MADVRESATTDAKSGLSKVGGDGPNLWLASANRGGAQKNDPPEKEGVADEFAGFPDDYTIAISPSKEMLLGLMGSWNKSDASVPEQWKRAAESMDLDSMIVVMRKYDAKNDRDAFSPYQPGWLTQETSPIDQIGLTVPNSKELRFKVRTVSKEQGSAERWIRSVWKGTAEFESDGAKRGDQSFESDATCPESRLGEFFITVMALSGPNIAI